MSRKYSNAFLSYSAKTKREGRTPVPMPAVPTGDKNVSLDVIKGMAQCTVCIHYIHHFHTNIVLVILNMYFRCLRSKMVTKGKSASDRINSVQTAPKQVFISVVMCVMKIK